MMRRILVAVMCLFYSLVAFAEDFPTKPITIIVPFGANGPTDLVARALAQAMGAALKTQITIDNVGGAGGTKGSTKAAQSPADGYTLLFTHIGHATAKALYPKLSYDPVADFEPIGLTVEVPMTLITRPNMAAANFNDLLAYLKANKANIKMANAGVGSASHLCGLLFQEGTGIELQTIPFKSTGQAIEVLSANNIDIMCDQTTNTIGAIHSNKVKAYAVTTKNRIPSLQNIPTMNESGLPGFEITVWHALYAPKGTPKPVLDKLNAALETALKDPAFVARMSESATTIVSPDRAKPEVLRSFLKSEIAKWSPIIKKAGVYAD